LASRLIVMRHGKVVEEGPAAELFARPQSGYTRALFEAAFNLEATECLALDDAAPAMQAPEEIIRSAHDDLGNP
jgi:ABC-type dipeptide/oligopeptide/nickel transport system ATPase component